MTSVSSALKHETSAHSLLRGVSSKEVESPSTVRTFSGSSFLPRSPLEFSPVMICVFSIGTTEFKMDRGVWCLIRSLVLVTGAAQLVAATAAAPSGDLIPSLPGQPEVGFLQYGGYINIDQAKGKNLFYYFVQATNSSATKPVNGGPGCSSQGGGFPELGPFYPKINGSGQDGSGFEQRLVESRTYAEHHFSGIASRRRILVCEQQ